MDGASFRAISATNLITAYQNIRIRSIGLNHTNKSTLGCVGVGGSRGKAPCTVRKPSFNLKPGSLGKIGTLKRFGFQRAEGKTEIVSSNRQNLMSRIPYRDSLTHSEGASRSLAGRHDHCSGCDRRTRRRFLGVRAVDGCVLLEQVSSGRRIYREDVPSTCVKYRFQKYMIAKSCLKG
jgi:hypothetical protein